MGAAVNPAVNPRQPAQGLLSLCKIWDYRPARVPLGPDYSCSLSPGLGVLLAKPRFCVCFLVPCTAGWSLGMGCSQFRFLSAEHPAGTSASIDAWLGPCPGRKALRREICAPCAGESLAPAPRVCALPKYLGAQHHRGQCQACHGVKAGWQDLTSCRCCLSAGPAWRRSWRCS